MTLQLVVPTGIVQVTTAATVEDDVLRTLVDLERLRRGDQHEHADSVLASHRELLEGTVKFNTSSNVKISCHSLLQ